MVAMHSVFGSFTKLITLPISVGCKNMATCTFKLQCGLKVYPNVLKFSVHLKTIHFPFVPNGKQMFLGVY